MSTQALHPTFITWERLKVVYDHDRWNPAFYDPRFIEVEGILKKLGSVPLGKFIPNKFPDGSKGITYGQVGARHLNPRGSVRYLQVVNLRETGIDFAVKPDRITEGSHNDPQRSRVQEDDILLSNTAFRGTETLIGRCVVVPRNYGLINISQDIDRIRTQDMNPYYVGVFIKSKYGQLQIQRFLHGVDSQKINFGHVRNLILPELPEGVQSEVERQYVQMSKCHDRAMAVKEKLLRHRGIEAGRYGEAINALVSKNATHNRAAREAKRRLDYLIAQLEAVIEGSQKKIKPFPS